MTWKEIEQASLQQRQAERERQEAMKALLDTLPLQEGQTAREKATASLEALFDHFAQQLAGLAAQLKDLQLKQTMFQQNLSEDFLNQYYLPRIQGNERLKQEKARQAQLQAASKPKDPWENFNF